MTTTLLRQWYLWLPLFSSLLAHGSFTGEADKPPLPPSHNASVIVYVVEPPAHEQFIINPDLDWLARDLLEEFPDLRVEFDLDTGAYQLWAALSDAPKVKARRTAMAAAGPRWLTTYPLDLLDADVTAADLTLQFPGVRSAVDREGRRVIVLGVRAQQSRVEARLDWLKTHTSRGMTGR